MKTLSILAFALTFTAPAHAQSHWYKSKRLWATFALTSAAQAADYRTSQIVFRRGGVETDPIFGARRPSFARMEAIGIPLDFAADFAGYRLSQSRPVLARKLWWVPAALLVQGHVRCALANSRW